MKQEPTTANTVSTRSVGAPGRFWVELAQSFRNPEFWALSSWLDIIVKARKSSFGILWLMAPSVVYVFGLGKFFAAMQPGSRGMFYAHVALGAMIFRSLMSSVIGSANIFHGSHSFIMDGHVRLTDYLLQSLAKSFFDMCMYLPVVAIALVIFGNVSLVGLLWALVALVVIYINGLWISAVFGLAGARYPDFGQLLNNVSIFLFLLTPIIWYPDAVPAGSHTRSWPEFVAAANDPSVSGLAARGSRRPRQIARTRSALAEPVRVLSAARVWFSGGRLPYRARPAGLCGRDPVHESC